MFAASSSRLMLAIVLLGAVAALVIFLRNRTKPANRPGKSPGDSLPSDDFQRLLGKRSQQPALPMGSKTSATVAAQTSKTGLTAAELMAEAKRLDTHGAGWPEILAVLNPSSNKTVADLLIAIRGPHMFAPGVAMQVIDAGCEEVLRSNANATSIDALAAARRSLDKIRGSDRY